MLDREIASYQWIPTGSICTEVLTKEIEMQKHMKELLVDGNFELRNDGINKVQCIDNEIRMKNIQNRDKSKIQTQDLH